MRGDVEGLVSLYEPGAVLAFPPGQLATGHEEITQPGPGPDPWTAAGGG